MFYRRKILLALLEAFGGSLTIHDCQALLLLFCKRREKNYYDFFPHFSGAHSFLLDQDKNRLTALDFLVTQAHFQQKTQQQTFVPQLKAKDRAVLQALVAEIDNISAKTLTHKVYSEFPYYASRNPRAKCFFDDEKYQQIQKEYASHTAPALFTIGYEGLSIDAYINLLLINNITSLVDIRKNPLSMKYGFSKTKLADYVSRVGISYFHIPELGIPSILRQNLHNSTAYYKLFDYYQEEILHEQEEAISLIKSISQEYGRIALTCFEANHLFCHRQKLIEYLQEDSSFDLPVIHLQNPCTIDASVEYTLTKNTLPHSYTRNARYSSTR